MERILTFLQNINCEIYSFRVGIMIRFINIGSIIIDFSNRNNIELAYKILIAHEENAITNIWIITYSLFFRFLDKTPRVIIVRPFAFELDFSPRIP